MNEPGFLECVAADRKHHGSWVDAFLTLGFWAVLNYRVAHWCNRNHLDILGRILQEASVIISGADISRRARIAPGLMLSHPNGVFIGPGVVMGRDCVLTQGCAIMIDTWGEKEHSIYPVIEDRVYIGAGAKVLGNITVHHDARISPNSLVLKDVPVNATALGVPARIMDFGFRHEGG